RQRRPHLHRVVRQEHHQVSRPRIPPLPPHSGANAARADALAPPTCPPLARRPAMDYILSILGPLAEGSLVTLQLFLITLLLAVPLGLALALVRISRFRVASQAVNAYIWLMRGT